MKVEMSKQLLDIGPEVEENRSADDQGLGIVM